MIHLLVVHYGGKIVCDGGIRLWIVESGRSGRKRGVVVDVKRGLRGASNERLGVRGRGL